MPFSAARWLATLLLLVAWLAASLCCSNGPPCCQLPRSWHRITHAAAVTDSEATCFFFWFVDCLNEWCLPYLPTLPHEEPHWSPLQRHVRLCTHRMLFIRPMRFACLDGSYTCHLAARPSSPSTLSVYTSLHPFCQDRPVVYCCRLVHPSEGMQGAVRHHAMIMPLRRHTCL